MYMCVCVNVNVQFSAWETLQWAGAVSIPPFTKITITPWSVAVGDTQSISHTGNIV